MIKLVKVRNFPRLDGFVDVEKYAWEGIEDAYWELFIYVISDDLSMEAFEGLLDYVGSLSSETIYWGKLNGAIYLSLYSPSEMIKEIEDIVDRFEKEYGKIDKN